MDRQGHFRGHELLDLVAARLEGDAARALWRPEDKGGRNTLRKTLESLEAQRRWDGERLAAHLTRAVPADHACPVALLLPRARSAAGELHVAGPRPAPDRPLCGEVQGPVGAVELDAAEVVLATPEAAARTRQAIGELAAALRADRERAAGCPPVAAEGLA